MKFIFILVIIICFSCSIQEKRNIQQLIDNQCPRCKPDSVKQILICGDKQVKHLRIILGKYNNIKQVETNDKIQNSKGANFSKLSPM